MKVGYYQYGITKTETGDKYRTNLKGFLGSFSKLDNPKFKSLFTHNDENVYLVHVVGDCYLFLITRNSEIIKRINSRDVTVGELAAILGEEEHIGFASYLLMKEDYFAYGSTVFAPRVDVFGDFINKLLKVAGIKKYHFTCEPIMHHATRADVQKMTHIGRTSLEITHQSNVFEDVCGVLGISNDAGGEVDAIEITIKPLFRQSQKHAIDAFLNKCGDDELKKLIIRAKSEATSQMLDLYVQGNGSVSEHVNIKEANKIPDALEAKSKNNTILNEKLKELRAQENAKVEEDISDRIDDLANVHSWDSIASRVLMGNK